MPRKKKRKKVAGEPGEIPTSIEAESFGDLSELEDTVDADWNGAPELEALDETRRWDGDVVDAMVGPDADALRASEVPTAEQALEDAVLDRLRIAVERLDEARAAGLGPLFEAVIREADPNAGERPVAGDDEMRLRHLARLDHALQQLETQSGQKA